jgi:hypothetical protein
MLNSESKCRFRVVVVLAAKPDREIAVTQGGSPDLSTPDKLDIVLLCLALVRAQPDWPIRELDAIVQAALVWPEHDGLGSACASGDLLAVPSCF